MTAAVLELLHVYRNRGAARALMACKADEVVVTGPVGTGKSRACLEKLNGLALKYPGMRGLIVRQVRDTLAASALDTYTKLVVPEQLEAGAIVYRGQSGHKPARFVYENKSELWVAGMDKPSKIMSTEFDVIYVMEATELKPEGWDALTTRLGRRNAIPYQQIIADCNPDKPTHWLKKRIDAGHTTELLSRHEDNPLFFGDDGAQTPIGRDYLAKLERLTGVRKLRLKDGKWAAAEGVIFESFDQNKHVIDAFKIPVDWPRFWSVDFGSVHPFVLQCWAKDPEGRLFMYRELYYTKRIVEDHARKILSIVAPNGEWIEPKPSKILCDHDAEDRDTLRRHLRLGNHPANKKVKPGLEAVEARFRDNRIFFFRTALVEKDPELEDAHKPVRTVDEFGGYVWDENKEMPVKEEDDGSDAVRYLVAEFDLKPGGPIYRSFNY